TAHLLDSLDDPFVARFSSSCPNVFISLPFLKAVETRLLNSGERFVMVGVTDAAGQPFALFPFVRRKRLGAVVIEGLDFGIADYFAPCLVSGATLPPHRTGALWHDV